MSRVKQLQNELMVAQAQIKDLAAENQTLKTSERRQGNALSKYEGTHAQLPQVIKSYSEDLRSLQTRLRRVKKSYQDLENSHRTQTAELLTIQKQHKHLLDLTKNKQLGEREKLSNQLEEAENRIKLQEKQNQNLMKKIELQDKNYQFQINSEIRKAKLLQADLKGIRETNNQLESKLENLKYKNYAGKHGYVWRATNGHGAASKSKAEAKNSLSNGVCRDNHGDHTGTLSGNRNKSMKPELTHSESDISDHTKDLQKNLIRQIHEDMINEPTMNINPDTSDTSDTKSWLDHRISESIQEKDSSKGERAMVPKFKPIVADNPFTLSGITVRQKSTDNRRKLLSYSNIDDKTLNRTSKMYVSKPQRYLQGRLPSHNDYDTSVKSSTSDDSE